MEDHLTISSDPEFEVEVHPAFASECTVDCNGETRSLYKQDRSKPVDVRGKGHPKQHQIRLKSKNGKRDVTLMVRDPNHSIAKITVELHPEGYDPAVQTDSSSTSDTTFSVMNEAFTCPPVC
jgi:ribosomal protein L31